MKEKPALFNTPMVRAILEGRKTVTRRVIRPQPEGRLIRMPANSCYPGCFVIEGTPRVIRPPCQPGDILWVRETWDRLLTSPGGHFRPSGVYYYRADGDIRPDQHKSKAWHPSIHMPREAARLFLQVTMVRAERLREMVLADVLMEGVQEAGAYEDTWDLWHQTWDRTIRPADRPIYGWAANPWMWVISFERVDRPEPSA